MNWVNTTVGEYCPFVYGKSLPQNQRVKGEVPVFGSNGCVDFHNASHVKKHGLIIGRKGSVGEVHLSKVPFWPIDTSFYVTKDSLEELYFTYYLLRSLGLNKMNSDSAVPGLNRDNAHALKIKIPEQDDGRKKLGKWIAEFDKKIELNNQINQTLEAMAQAIFKSWFVDFEPVKAKMEVLQVGGNQAETELAAMMAISGKNAEQLSAMQATLAEAYQQLTKTAALFPSSMQDSELGEIPVGWSVQKAESLVRRLNTEKRYAKTDVNSFGLVPVYEQGANILLGFHDLEAGLKASKESPMFIFGDHTCVMHLSCKPFDISANVIPLEGKVYPTVWTYYALLGKQTFQEYRRHWSELIVKDVVTPAEELATKFTEIITENICLRESLAEESLLLTQQRDSLLPKLLSGEIDLSAIDEVAA